MAVVHEPIEDGVGEGRLVDVGVPVIDGQLTGDQSGFLVVAVFQDLQQVGEIGETKRAPPSNRKSEDITGTNGHDRHLTYEYDAADQVVRWADTQTGRCAGTWRWP